MFPIEKFKTSNLSKIFVKNRDKIVFLIL